MARLLFLAIGLIAALPAHAMCVPAAEFRQLLADWGESVRYGGMSARGGEPVAIYIAVGDKGSWTAFFVDGDTAACVLATGEKWTEQGDVPAAPRG